MSISRVVMVSGYVPGLGGGGVDEELMSREGLHPWGWCLSVVMFARISRVEVAGCEVRWTSRLFVPADGLQELAEVVWGLAWGAVCITGGPRRLTGLRAVSGVCDGRPWPSRSYLMPRVRGVKGTNRPPTLRPRASDGSAAGLSGALRGLGVTFGDF